MDFSVGGFVPNLGSMISLPRRRLLSRTWMLPCAAALCTAVFIPVYRLQDLSWPEATAAAITFVAPCFLFGWVVWRLLMRRPQMEKPARALLTHAVTAAAFSITWTIPLVVLVYVMREEVSPAYLRGGAVWQLVWGLVIYAVLMFAARAYRHMREQELAAASAELQALRAQLDPHFLFNTLHSLTQLAHEDPDATQNALQRFGELMRYRLKSGREAGSDIPLEQELEFVRHYLALEKLRLGDRLLVVENIDPEALELGVPPLLLQPLVENAIRHGLAPRARGGTVRLSASMAADQLIIVVCDDGEGAEPGRISESNGLGLKSVKRQLDAHFQGQTQMTLDTQPQRGFTVTLRMPARLPKEGADAHHIDR
jgi:two-component system LytT family sensor kinase